MHGRDRAPLVSSKYHHGGKRSSQSADAKLAEAEAAEEGLEAESATSHELRSEIVWQVVHPQP